MSNSEEALLRRAAKTVRERGEVAAGEPLIPWSVDPSEGCEGQEVIRGPLAVAECRDPDDAAWIALVGPQLAEPLAAWLDDAAHWCSGGGQFIHSRSPTGRAVAVARALLGEPAMTVPVGDDRQEEK